MNYDNFTTFNVETENAITWVTFDYPPVNIQGTAMLDDLNNLAEELECDRFGNLITVCYLGNLC